MHIQSITLKNFRCFEKLSLDLHPRLNVFLGENGAGKSAVLNALQLLLGRLTVYMLGSVSPVPNIGQADILHERNEAKIEISVAWNGELSWSMTAIKERPSGLVKTAYGDSALHHVIVGNDFSQVPIAASYMTGRTCSGVFWENDGDFNCPVGIKECYLDAISQSDCFRLFVSWFNEQEAIENESILSQMRLSDKLTLSQPLEYDKQLQSVKSALAAFFESFSNFTVNRKKRVFVATKNGQEHDLSQLSDGERIYILLVADIARRLAIANPTLNNPLEGEGIILIDEIELHLHPKWQRTIIPKLLKTFPHCQFIVTSHSPQVLGEIEDINSIWILEEGQEPYHPSRAYGMESSELLREVMGAGSRTKEVTEALEKIDRLIDDEHFDEARAAIKELAAKTGKIPAIIGANSYLTMMGQEQVELED